MKNNKVLTIVLICICSIFTILLSIFLVVSIKDKNKFTFYFDFFKKGESNNLIYNESFDDINKNVNIKVSSSNIYIKNSSDNKAILKMYGSEKSKDDLKVTKEDDLNINVESKGCIGFCFNNEVDKVILYLPETFDKKINIENSYGDAKIEKFENVILNAKISSGDINVDTVKEINIDNDYGDVFIKKVETAKINASAGDIKIDEAKNINADNNYGDIKIKNVYNYINLNCDCGDIKINNATLNKNSVIKDDYGDITISNIKNVYIDSKTDYGDNDINNNDRKSDIVLKIENNCGDIKVNN